MADKPDYVQEVIVRYEGGFIGFEELAARLKSIVPWDLKGNIILAEDFESEETEWTLGQTGGSSLASRSSRQKFSGDWSIKLFTDDVALAWANATRCLYYPGGDKLAICAMFGFDQHQTDLRLALSIDDGTTGWDTELRYRFPSTELAIHCIGDTWEVIDSDLWLGMPDLGWYPFRLDFDLTTGKYHKLYVAHREYDISAYTPDTGASAGIPSLGVTAQNGRIVSTGCTIYVDDIIVAKNVP